MNRRLVHDVAMATTKACVECFRWSDEQEYREAFDSLYPAIEGGLLYLLTALDRESQRLAKPRIHNPEED